MGYKTTLASIVLALSVAVGCSSRDNPDLIPMFGDAGPSQEWIRECPVGDLLETIDVRYDQNNCGDCGVTCDDIAQCLDGDCLYPGFLDYSCEDDTWCEPGQVCWTFPFGGGSYCVVPSKLGCELDGCNVEEGELCISGYCTMVTEDICDGWDNDRDGDIDENVLPRHCYDGPIETQNVGMCTDGKSRCIDGAYETCTGSITPIEEMGILACDGLDNNCDGCADDRYDSSGECRDPDPLPFDIVVMIDVSGSMGGEIDAVIDSADEFAARFAGNPYFRFALFKLPMESGETWASLMVRSFTNFTDYQSGLEDVRRYFVTSLNAWEPSLDVPYLIASGHYEPGLRFRDNSQRIYILFTDENAQSRPYAGSPYVNPNLLCSAFQEEDIFAVVTDPRYFGQWGNCALYIPITDEVDVAVEGFDEILNSACDPTFVFDPIEYVPPQDPLPIPRGV